MYEDDEAKNVRFSEGTKENDGGERPVHKDNTCLERILSDRPQWQGLFEFNAALLAFSFNTTSLSWFPSYCLRHGGAAALLPYCLHSILITSSYYLVELQLGQFSGQGSVAVWRFSPIFKGIGIASVAFSVLVFLGLITQTIWAIRVMGDVLFSHTSSISKCSDPLYSSSACSVRVFPNCTSHSSCFPPYKYGPLEVNASTAVAQMWRLPMDDYFHNRVIGIGSGLESYSLGPWELVLSLLLTWLLIWAFVFPSGHCLGKMSYPLVLFPVCSLLAILVCSLQVDGSEAGILRYIKPDFNALLNLHAWGEGALLSVATLLPCWGPLTCMGSYNATGARRFFHSCYVIPFLIAILSFSLGTVPVGALMGAISADVRWSVDAFDQQDIGMLFISIPQSLQLLPRPSIWLFLYATTIMCLSISTIIPIIDSIVTALCDEFPEKLEVMRTFVFMAVWSAGFLLSFAVVTKAGAFLYILVSRHISTWTVILLSWGTVIVVAVAYGVDRAIRDLHRVMCSKHPISNILYFNYYLSVPLIGFLSIIYALSQYRPPSYGSYEYPTWSILLAWLLVIVPLALVGFVALNAIHDVGRDVSCAVRWNILTKPSENWGRYMGNSKPKPSANGRAPTVDPSSDESSEPSSDLQGQVMTPDVDQSLNYSPPTDDGQTWDNGVIVQCHVIPPINIRKGSDTDPTSSDTIGTIIAQPRVTRILHRATVSSSRSSCSSARPEPLFVPRPGSATLANGNVNSHKPNLPPIELASASSSSCSVGTSLRDAASVNSRTMNLTDSVDFSRESISTVKFMNEASHPSLHSRSGRFAYSEADKSIRSGTSSLPSIDNPSGFEYDNPEFDDDQNLDSRKSV